MTFLKKILKAPIRNTAIFFGVSLIAYLLFALVLLYITRVICASSLDVTGSCRGTSLQMAGSMILNDFELLFRIATELSVIILISQVIYRLVTKKSK